MKVGYPLSLFMLWTMDYIFVRVSATVFFVTDYLETQSILYVACARGLHLYALAQAAFGLTLEQRFRTCSINVMCI